VGRLDGLVQPDEFIDLAEQTGLIIPLGVDAAPLAHRPRGLAVRRAGGRRRGQRVGTTCSAPATSSSGAVAVTELDLARPRHAGDHRSDARHTAWNLAVLEEPEPRREPALDDFGTGYSASPPPPAQSTIKIDRSFLDGVDAGDGEATVRAIVELARAHGMEVVAEGIETTATRPRARAGCHRGQGYLFGRPERLDAALLSLRVAMLPPRRRC
jgi:predicted signal transduction protein with EAL and GGDEF domain